MLHGLQAGGALTHDTDPDPARLVGTMHWTKGNPPHPLPPDTDGHSTEYDFTATYDLTGTQTAIVAVDEPASVVGYTSTGSAPPRTRNVLTNDIGTDLRISSADADFGEALAPSLDGGEVRYAPPVDGFVGDDTVTYGIRAATDPATTVRDTAEWKLRYLQCRRHDVWFEGVNLGGKPVVTATGDIRVCSDGTNIETDSVHLSTDTTKRMIGARALNKSSVRPSRR